MDVRVDPAGQDQQARGIDDGVRRRCEQRTQSDDLFSLDEDVTGVAVGGRDDMTVLNQQRHNSGIFDEMIFGASAHYSSLRRQGSRRTRHNYTIAGARRDSWRNGSRQW